VIKVCWYHRRFYRRWYQHTLIYRYIYNSIGEAAQNRSSCIKSFLISAEDPSENFQRVRDFVDTKNCSTLNEFLPENIHSNFTTAMAKAAREHFKINKVRF